MLYDAQIPFTVIRSLDNFLSDLKLWSFLHAAKSLQSCPTLCDPIDGSPPGSPVPGILQARTLEWVAISFSNAWKGKVKGKSLSSVRPSATPWTAAYQAPPSMGFSRQEYWSGLPLPSLHFCIVNDKRVTFFKHSLKKHSLGSYYILHTVLDPRKITRYIWFLP